MTMVLTATPDTFQNKFQHSTLTILITLSLFGRTTVRVLPNSRGICSHHALDVGAKVVVQIVPVKQIPEVAAPRLGLTSAPIVSPRCFLPNGIVAAHALSNVTSAGTSSSSSLLSRSVQKLAGGVEISARKAVGAAVLDISLLTTESVYCI
jgi:hypothetical protein